MPLILHGMLIAQMVMSVTRQVVQIGFCTGMTITGCNRRVFPPRTKQLLQCIFSWYSQVGMYLSAGRFLYILREAVCPFGVFLCQYLSFLCYIFFKILVSACFSIPIPLIICACFKIPIFSYVCSCFTVSNPVEVSSFYILVASLYPCSCHHVMV